MLVAPRMRFLAAAAVLASGCGTSILLSYPAHEPFLRANSEVTVATRPLEDRVQTTVARIQTGPLRVACETTTLASKVEATYLDTFDGLGRVWCGFMALSEGTIAAAIGLTGRNTPSTIAASIVGADAVGALAYAIVASSASATRTEVGTSLPETAQTCVNGLVVRAGDRTWAVEPDGSLAGDLRALASAAVAGQAIAIAGNGVEVSWSADASERCALVGQFGIDDPSGACARPADVAAAAASRVAVPLQLRIRLRVPRK